VLIPGAKHPMFELGLSNRDERCHNFIQLIKSTILRSQDALHALTASSQSPPFSHANRSRKKDPVQLFAVK